MDYDQFLDEAQQQLLEQLHFPSPQLPSLAEPQRSISEATEDSSSSSWESTVEEAPVWISVGNCLYKTSVLAGITFLLGPLALPRYFSCSISLPAGVLSVASCTLYGISWQFDPCGKYQIILLNFPACPSIMFVASTAFGLVRKDDQHKKRLRTMIALAVVLYSAKKIYEIYA